MHLKTLIKIMLQNYHITCHLIIMWFYFYFVGGHLWWLQKSIGSISVSGRILTLMLYTSDLSPVGHVIYYNKPSNLIVVRICLKVHTCDLFKMNESGDFFSDKSATLFIQLQNFCDYHVFCHWWKWTCLLHKTFVHIIL